MAPTADVCLRRTNLSPATILLNFRCAHRGGTGRCLVAATRVRRSRAASVSPGGAERGGAGIGAGPEDRCIDAIGIASLKELSTSGISVTTAAKIAPMGSPAGPASSSGIAGFDTITVMTSFTPFTKSTTASGEAAACVVSSHAPALSAR